ncbi:hypothetical protein HDV57DRAFT_63533 [Trichoderma longibrachiatum]|uniref:Uncharacterized protein n=1 Tax=Trichoderma longibrachiatum ATCC 18648 TaxID=983965 RepID=A0A2T4CF07_TRILO|nr:hypothetical protein M440DRAFT_181285 [Trichoderma longibrachiatum ATCC 18648]
MQLRPFVANLVRGKQLSFLIRKGISSSLSLHGSLVRSVKSNQIRQPEPNGKPTSSFYQRSKLHCPVPLPPFEKSHTLSRATHPPTRSHERWLEAVACKNRRLSLFLFLLLFLLLLLPAPLLIWPALARLVPPSASRQVSQRLASSLGLPAGAAI